jgi:signal peptidase I
MSTAFSDTTTGKIFNFIIGRDKKKHAHGDPTREVFETVVFVVVLVLMLKLFVAEAFVIPTGSMATTLWGDQIQVTCPECGNTFPVTAAARNGMRNVPRETACQNCGLQFVPANPQDYSSGDRVLVGKYEYHIRPPKRFDVPVFKYPEEPYSRVEKSAMNYIKRLVGLSGETIAIYKGDLYVTRDLTYPDRPRPDRPEDLWKREYTYSADSEAVALFQKGGFAPVRKTPQEILTVRRLVFDLDQQPKSLTGLPRTRWEPVPGDGAGWTMGDKGFRHTGTATGWMRYQHVEASSWRVDPRHGPSVPRQPAFILDHLAYNVTDSGNPAHYWVPDLILECTAEFGAANDRVVLELTKAGDKFRAEFDNDVCRLFFVPGGTPDKPTQLGEPVKTGISSGRYHLRFANVDSRLTVWVDGKVLDFGTAADYATPNKESFEPTTTDQHEPARIGATGTVGISKVQLWRDVYYTCNEPGACGVQTYYVQPGHYFCLGDNSASSADGRSWGLVPERLMLGRAVVVYWPISRIGVIK